MHWILYSGVVAGGRGQLLPKFRAARKLFSCRQIFVQYANFRTEPLVLGVI